MTVTRDQIVQGLRSLGVGEGMVLMAHVSLSAIGQVAGGAEAVISALLEALGPTGTLAMPAMSSEQPFRVESSPSNVGAVTERFRSWPGVVRGLHPTHSACCLGPEAEALVAGHVTQPTALGPESPWGRLARHPRGHVLLLGCDQDRNTLLHCAEEAVDAPYLMALRRTYVDQGGAVRTVMLDKFPGPHRDFIGLDRLFQRAGAMRVGKVGGAVCRLMNAGASLELTLQALREDPAAVLCDNPGCQDCVRQRAAITRRRLSQEDFTLAALVDDLGLPLEQLPAALEIVQGQGVDALEFGSRLTGALLALPEAQLASWSRILAGHGARAVAVTCPAEADLRPAGRVAQALGASLLKLPPQPPGTDAQGTAELSAQVTAAGLTPVVENSPGTAWDTREACERLRVAAPELRLAFNPAHFARVGERPFLGAYYRGKLKRALAQLVISDGFRPGGEPYTLPGCGQGEIKELVSILRCRSFPGTFLLKVGPEVGKDAFVRHCAAFWRLMDTL